MPRPAAAPPQKGRALRRGEALLGRSFWVLGRRRGLFGGVGAAVTGAATGAKAEGIGEGGGRTGVSGTPRAAMKCFLRAAISWRSAMFSDWEEPSSERIAVISESRSEMSASRVEMYSVANRNQSSLG